jgi:hypothetical protein
MQNMTMKREGNKLVIEIDLTKVGEASKSGKTLIVASSRGNQPVPDSQGYVIGLNLFKYRE